MPEDSVQAAALSSHLQHLPGPTSAQNCSSTPEHPQQGGWGCGERDLGETGRQNLSPQKMGLSGPEGKRHIEFAGMPRILDTTSSGQWSPDEKCRGPVHRALLPHQGSFRMEVGEEGPVHLHGAAAATLPMEAEGTFRAPGRLEAPV